MSFYFHLFLFLVPIKFHLNRLSYFNTLFTKMSVFVSLFFVIVANQFAVHFSKFSAFLRQILFLFSFSLIRTYTHTLEEIIVHALFSAANIYKISNSKLNTKLK